MGAAMMGRSPSTGWGPTSPRSVALLAVGSSASRWSLPRRHQRANGWVEGPTEAMLELELESARHHLPRLRMHLPRGAEMVGTLPGALQSVGAVLGPMGVHVT